MTSQISLMRLLLAVALLFAAASATAHEVTAGPISVVHPIVRASLAGSPNSAAYLTVRNAGTQPDRLLSAMCTCARKVELHSMSTADGRMTMRPSGPVTVAPGGRVDFKPGGLHLMLLGLKTPLEAGTTVEMTLTFEKAGPVKAPFFATARVEEEMKAHGAGHRH